MKDECSIFEIQSNCCFPGIYSKANILSFSSDEPISPEHNSQFKMLQNSAC
jgi:hypothetical protein